MPLVFFVPEGGEPVFLERARVRERGASSSRSESIAGFEPMSAARDAGWYRRHYKEGFIRHTEGQLDRIDIEIAGLRRLQFEETKARLERLGFDTTNYRPPPYPHWSEELRKPPDGSGLLRA